jgi:hypothetical protein
MKKASKKTLPVGSARFSRPRASSVLHFTGTELRILKLLENEQRKQVEAGDGDT